MAGHGILIEIIGDATSYLRSADKAIAANTRLAASTTRTSKTDVAAVDAQIAARAKLIEVQRAQVAQLTARTGRAAAGTPEAVAQTALLAEANAKLARSQGDVITGNRRLSSSSKTAERDLNKVVRGGLAGSGIFGKMGRSLAFASSGFIAFAVGAELITKSITNAEEFEKATNSLRVAIQHTGGDVAKLQPRYEATAKAAARFGVTEVEATTSLARATVLTGNAASAQRAYQEALVISKATGKDFNLVLTATSKAQAGITTSLRRYGVLVDANMSGTDQFRLVMKRFGGQAAANTTSLERLRAQFSNALTTIGVKLLPAVNQLADGFAKWLEKMNRSGKLQSDVVKGMKAITFVATPLVSSIKELATAVGLLNDAWGKLSDLQKGGGIKGLFAGVPAAGFGFLKSGIKSSLFPVQNLVNAFSSPKPPPAPLIQPSRFFPESAQFSRTPDVARSFGKPMKQFFQQFELTFKENLAQVQASLTRSNKDDVAAARQVVARVKRAIDQGQLHGKGLIAGLQLEAQALQTIWAAEDAAAQKRAQRAQAAKERIQRQIEDSIDPLRLEVSLSQAQALGKPFVGILKQLREAAKKALESGKLTLAQQKEAWDQIASLNQQIKDALTTQTAQFQVPAKLALRLARDTALGRSTTKDLLSIRKAILRFIATHKHNLAALTDAYNQLADINQQLGSTAGTALGLFKQASTRALTRGLGLTDEQRKQLRARLSQLGPGGTVPGHGVGAAGFVIGPDGRPIQVHGRGPTISARDRQTVNPVRFNRLLRVLEQVSRRPIRVVVDLDGKIIADNTTRHQQRGRQRNSAQRRGPNAGAAGA